LLPLTVLDHADYQNDLTKYKKFVLRIPNNSLKMKLFKSHIIIPSLSLKIDKSVSKDILKG
jgi:hypothetical protein